MNKLAMLYPLLLLNYRLLYSMEQPLKKIKIIKKIAQIYQPLTLAQQSADVIISKLSLYQNALKDVATDIQENHINSRLLDLLKKKFIPRIINKYQITTMAYDSDSVFTDDGNYILSTHCSNNSIELYRLSDILKGKFKRIDKLDCVGSHLICAKPSHNKVYYINRDDRLKEFQLQETKAPSHEIIYDEEICQLIDEPNQETLQLVCTQVSKCLASLESALTKIFPHPQEGIFALSTRCDTGGNFLNQSIYRVMLHEKPQLVLSIQAEAKKILKIYGTSNNCIAYIHQNGDVKVVDSSNHVVNNWENNAKHRTVLSCNINRDKNKIAVADNAGTVTIFDLSAGKLNQFKHSSPSNALAFLDEHHLIAAHNQQVVQSEQVLLTLWNIVKNRCIATSMQKEGMYCNTLDVSPDKQFLLLGMGRYDIAVQSMNSFIFSFEFKSLNFTKLCMKETPDLIEKLTRKDSSFEDKLAFIDAEI